MNLKSGTPGSRTASGQGGRVVLLVVIAVIGVLLGMLYDDLVRKGISPYPPKHS